MFRDEYCLYEPGSSVTKLNYSNRHGDVTKKSKKQLFTDEPSWVQEISDEDEAEEELKVTMIDDEMWNASRSMCDEFLICVSCFGSRV